MLQSNCRSFFHLIKSQINPRIHRLSPLNNSTTAITAYSSGARSRMKEVIDIALQNLRWVSFYKSADIIALRKELDGYRMTEEKYLKELGLFAHSPTAQTGKYKSFCWDGYLSEEGLYLDDALSDYDRRKDQEIVDPLTQVPLVCSWLMGAQGNLMQCIACALVKNQKTLERRECLSLYSLLLEVSWMARRPYIVEQCNISWNMTGRYRFSSPIRIYKK